MDKLKLAEQALIKEDVPNFGTGDSVNVYYRVREGEKERIQQFEGDVISRKGSGANQTFMVRKVSAGNIGVERIFPLNSPFIAKIEVLKEGDVRRSKLYYLRERSGKSARIKEKDQRQGEVEAAVEENAEEVGKTSIEDISTDTQETVVENENSEDKKEAGLKEKKDNNRGSEAERKEADSENKEARSEKREEQVKTEEETKSAEEDKAEEKESKKREARSKKEEEKKKPSKQKASNEEE